MSIFEFWFEHENAEFVAELEDRFIDTLCVASEAANPHGNLDTGDTMDEVAGSVWENNSEFSQGYWEHVRQGLLGANGIALSPANRSYVVCDDNALEELARCGYDTVPISAGDEGAGKALQALKDWFNRQGSGARSVGLIRSIPGTRELDELDLIPQHRFDINEYW